MLPGDYDDPPGLRATGAMHPVPRCPTRREGHTAPWGRVSLSSPSCLLCSGLGLTLGPEGPSPDSHHKGTPRVWGKESL